MHILPKKIYLIVFVCILIPVTTYSFEKQTRYATIIYDDEQLIKQFNKKLRIGNLNQFRRPKHALTAADELGNKIDIIINKNKSILDMYPKKIKFKLVILRKVSDVHNAYKRIYGKKRRIIAFYSTKENTVFVCAKKAPLRVVAHELAHVIMEHYFKIAPPVKIHEILAQYAEKKITE